MNAEFPAQRLEPWHAVFRGSSDCASELVESARQYGAHCVSVGLAKDFKIIGLSFENEVHMHCIPHESRVDLLDYWKKLVDDNDQS